MAAQRAAGGRAGLDGRQPVRVIRPAASGRVTAIGFAATPREPVPIRMTSQLPAGRRPV